MSLGRTGTMWLIQPNLPPLSYIHKHMQTHSPTHAYSRSDACTQQTCLHLCCVHKQESASPLMGWSKHKNKNLAPFDFHQISTTQLHCNTVNFLLCYFIDCGHNYPLFWSTALSEFPLCWTISTEGWLSHAIPQPEGTVYVSCTLIIISKAR